MSQVKFEQQETIRTTQQNGGGRGGGRGGPPPPPQREDLAHKVGDALTQGSGPNGYLAVSSNPNNVLRQPQKLPD
jgi:hypothetical protein